MANVILTPITLWKDFDESLPFDEEIVSEERVGPYVHRDVYFYGRDTGEGRVKIFAHYVFPAEEKEFPAVLMLFEAGFPFDSALAARLLDKGYAVLGVDYCGEGEGRHTVYPPNVDYANYSRAGRHLSFCDETAKETSWYEWAGVARYAVRYLHGCKGVTKVGAMGMRTGGEILFKIAPYAELSCMISVCAAGWLAYRGIEKFSGENEMRTFDVERHRFIAGLDSQSYAPYVTCPVLLLSAINDKKYNYDRVYDTFRQINPEVEKAILFSAHGNGLIGTHSLENIYLFLDKYLKVHSVFVSKPIDVDVEEDGEGNLVVKGTFDPEGEIKEYGIFFTENVSAFKSRDWTRVFGKSEDLDENNVGTVPLGIYEGSDKALVYAFVNYSNNFSMTSKILEVNLKKKYKNSVPSNRILYCEADGENGFASFRRRARSIADCFMDGTGSDVIQLPGYGGIKGITSPCGIITYRVGEPRYAAPEGASFRFDAYCKTDARVRVMFYKNDEECDGFTAEAPVEGGGKWKSVLMEAGDFKSETGAPLGDFSGVVSVVFYSDDEVLVNNVLWI